MGPGWLSGYGIGCVSAWSMNSFFFLPFDLKLCEHFFLRGEGERRELGYFKRTGLDDPHGSLPTWDILWFHDSMNLWKELYHDNVQGLYYFVSNVWIIQLLSWGSSWCFAYHWGLDNFLTLHPTNILQNFLIHPGGLTPAGSFPVFGEKNQKSTNEKTHELR